MNLKKHALALSLLTSAIGNVSFAEDVIVSFNVLCAEVCSRNPKIYEPWNRRRDPVFSLIKAENPDLMAIQEVYGTMLHDFKSRFSPEYEIYQGTLDDQSASVSPGHLNLIIFRKSKYTFVTGGSFRLSDKPSTNVNRVQNAYRRTCTWALLETREKESQRFRFLSCHLPFDSKQQSQIATQTLANWLWTGNMFDLPQIVAGDFNRSSTQDSIAFLTGPSGFKPEFSYPTHFRPLVDELDAKKVDYVFHSNLYTATDAYLRGVEPYRGNFRYSDHPMVVLRGSLVAPKQVSNRISPILPTLLDTK